MFQLKEKPAAYIQQIVVTVLIEPVNNSLLVPLSVREAFQPVFKILRDINEHKHTERYSMIQISIHINYDTNKYTFLPFYMTVDYTDLYSEVP